MHERGARSRVAMRQPARLRRVLLPGLRLLLALAPALAVLLTSEPAAAYTWMIRHGYATCVTCHTDPSGGELLTPYGRVQGDLILRMRYGKDNVAAAASDTKQTESFDSFDSFDSFEAPAKTESKPVESAPAEAEQGGGGVSKTSGFLWGLWEPPDFLLLGGSGRVASTYEFGDQNEY